MSSWVPATRILCAPLQFEPNGLPVPSRTTPCVPVEVPAQFGTDFFDPMVFPRAILSAALAFVVIAVVRWAWKSYR